MSDLIVSGVGFATPASATLGVTVADLVEATRDHLHGSARGSVNVVSEDLDASETDVTFTYDLRASGVRVGATVEVDSELMLVLATSGSTASVRRGQRGTTAASHLTGALASINPRFPTERIRQALKADILALPPEMYGAVTVDLTAGAAVDALDLDGASGHDVTRLLVVRRDPFNSEENWPRVAARLARHQDTTDFPSGYAIEFTPLGRAHTVRVTYAVRFSTTTFDLVTDLGAVGLTASMLDIPPLGAAWRLVGATEAPRTDTAARGQSKDAQDVPAGHRLRTGDWFRDQRQYRIGEELARLVGLYGTPEVS